MSETTFTFYWLDGTRRVLPGETPADALTRAGYGGGAMRALDFYASGDNREWEWSTDDSQWQRVKSDT